ncbi:MAG: hypothetical protein ACK5R0_10020 [Bacteroidota bacterium]|jgi:hypothetical protein|nr:hypothetical protein [Flammeovirgaceae bacterium]MCZ8071077.1 hypothetical protein [Cytophagales bacterium]
MAPRITFLFLMLNAYAFAQTQATKDSLVNEMCNTIINSQSLGDSARVAAMFRKHLFPFLDKYPESLRDELGMNIYFRMQRNCDAFKDLLHRVDPPKGDWQAVEKKLTTSLNKKGCRGLLDHNKLSYLESSGDTVQLVIDKGMWVDRFKDGTYSKLKMRWISDCEFEIEFIESNNASRKGLSKKGDKYLYQVFDKKDNYYDMSVQIPGSDRYMVFKLYY